MFVPPHFAETGPARLFDFIDRHSFGLLVSTADGVPFATHLPFLLDRSAGPHGTLLGHVARANPQWRELAGQPVLAVFSGPHAYISPTWYETPNTVPTWNYVSVHAYGTCELIADEVEVLRILTDTVAKYESGMPQPWGFPPGDDFIRKLAAGIVAFRIPIDRLEGKAKLNQNHPPERRERVSAKLAASADPDSQEIARLMRGEVP